MLQMSRSSVLRYISRPIHAEHETLAAFSTAALLKPENLIENPLETTPLLGSQIPVQSQISTEDHSVFRLLPRVLKLAGKDRHWVLAGTATAALAGMTSPATAVIFGNMIGAMSPCNPETASCRQDLCMAARF